MPPSATTRPLGFLALGALCFVTGGASRDAVGRAAAPAAERVLPNDNRTPAGTLRGDVLELRLEARVAEWHADGDDAPANVAAHEGLCGDTVVTAMLGGTPAAVPMHYAHASPIARLPLGVPQVLVWGEHEDRVPRPLAEAYAQAAARSVAVARSIVVPGAGHCEIASPRSPAWPRVVGAIRALLDGGLPAEGR